MEVDAHATAKEKKVPNRKSGKTSATEPPATWSKVVGRKARKRANAGAPDKEAKQDFPPLPARPSSRKLPPFRSSALIVKVPTGSSYEETVKCIRSSGINPDEFGATVKGFRRTRARDVAVELGKGQKSRAAAEPLKNALAEKLPGVVASVTNSGSLVDMEVIDLEPTSTVEEVLAAVKSALLTAGKNDPLITAAVHCVSVTSMWGLKNGQQVAKVSVPRAARPTEVGRIRIGWTSCRFPI
ncbi:hypothetical protein AGLY_002040 [Aphis glycines]|uniref:Uncharacterized protein n=1 Tax=Aphis glycines TaxID=307491 RepID=A0A6G0U3I9_APHGL|nr:hypothetical protein AGLY_002040 [Aphis glycines]